MGISTLVHLGFIQDLVFLSHVDSCIFLGWGASAGDEDLHGAEGDGGGTLVELVACVISQLLDGPLVFVYIIAETYL